MAWESAWDRTRNTTLPEEAVLEKRDGFAGDTMVGDVNVVRIRPAAEQTQSLCVGEHLPGAIEGTDR